MTEVITGFHAIEELLKSYVKNGKTDGAEKHGKMIFYSKPGPRAKAILRLAEELNIPAEKTDDAELDKKTQGLPAALRGHRGIVLVSQDCGLNKDISFEQMLALLEEKENSVVLILDSVSDPHNAGSIVRSADQFAADAVIIPEKKSAGADGTILKTSAGAAAWVPMVTVVNLVRAVKALKKAGFWIFGADCGGEPLHCIKFPEKTAVVMGCEGSGIARLLEENCDTIISIPTAGKIDSLNVSVAAGIILYEIRRQKT